MTSLATQFRWFVFILLPRLRWVFILLLIGTGLAVAALERWRPELVAPWQEPAYRTVSEVLAPVRELSRMGQGAVEHVSQMSGAQGEADRLRTELMRREAELQVAREEVRRLGRVSGLRQWRSPADLEFVPADVVAFATDDRSALFTINRGERDGLEPGLPVVGQHGLAGVIRQVSARSALVQALRDPLSAVGVVSLETRERGIVLGRGHDRDPEFIPENEVQAIEPGMVLISSGFANSVYPKGLIVGRIKEKRTSERGVIYGVMTPAEDFDSLEEVLVVRLVESARGRPEGMAAYEVEMPAAGFDPARAPVQTDAPTMPAAPLDMPTTPSLDLKTTDSLPALAPASPTPPAVTMNDLPTTPSAEAVAP